MTNGPFFPPNYDPTADANRYTQLLWSHLNTWIQKFIGNHHLNHEPGGKDFVNMTLGGLKDVLIYSPEVAQVLSYTMLGTVPIWMNMAATALGGTIAYGTASAALGTGQAFFNAFGSITPSVIPGPANLYGVAMQITEVLFSADGDVAGSEAVSGQSFSFGAGGGSDDNTSLTATWDAGERLSMTITAAGTVSYVTADVKFMRGTT